MSAPFRKIYTDETSVETITGAIKAWEEILLRKQGLSNFGMFSRPNVSKDEVPREDVNISSLNKRGK